MERQARRRKDRRGRPKPPADVRAILEALEEAYPEARTALEHETPWQLLVATILSAQCTDEKVNEVTDVLFRRHGTPRALADAVPETIEAIVHPTGFYRQKTKSIQATARDVVERFGGVVPKTLEELTSLRGVARKTANVVLGNAFGVPGLAVDTHLKRVNQRLGFTSHDEPDRIERDLMELVPQEDWTRYTHRVIHHGRVCCTARSPRCETCPLREECPWPRRRPAGAVQPRPGSKRRRRT